MSCTYLNHQPAVAKAVVSASSRCAASSLVTTGDDCGGFLDERSRPRSRSVSSSSSSSSTSYSYAGRPQPTDNTNFTLFPNSQEQFDTSMDGLTYGINVKDWRKPYQNAEEPILLEKNLPSEDPFDVFDVWFKNIAAKTDVSFEEVNAACFSTSLNNRPTSRMVLVKEYDRRGFSFYTNYDSRKGRELTENPFACLLFYWPKVDRQVRIEGKVEKLPSEVAEAYWNTRPVKSRIGSKVSSQSSVIPSRQYLIEKRSELETLAKNAGEAAITKPDCWGGYCLVPDYFEFWQGQSDRLHDRIVFEKIDANGHSIWTRRRLSP